MVYCRALGNEGSLNLFCRFVELLVFAEVAQLVERRTENPCVAGSSPALGNFYFLNKDFNVNAFVDKLFYVASLCRSFFFLDGNVL